MDPRAPGDRPRRTLRRAERVGLQALVLVAGLSPWLLALARVRATEIALVFRALCHQRPERTLVLFGDSMLVCSRCAGLYAGVALGALLPLPRRLLPRGRALVLGAIAVTLVDIVTQDLGLHPPLHPVRLATGLLLGWSASGFMFSALRSEAAAAAARP
jgi:uncharacterized membrane protein